MREEIWQLSYRLLVTQHSLRQSIHIGNFSTLALEMMSITNDRIDLLLWFKFNFEIFYSCKSIFKPFSDNSIIQISCKLVIFEYYSNKFNVYSIKINQRFFE